MVPGEQLPRWSLNCFWRKDGERSGRRRALRREGSRLIRARGERAAAAARWRGAWGIGEKHVFGAYEDPLYYLWRERKLPANVDPLDCDA